ncbi:nucleoside 2-deoxyribosyltransferase (plasmid) [Salipiger sp. H15]|uniref:Nucleoside 2-deoxyribosyltransferase n=1 Tax=Alloyangia sp. H15 TaxID=3029062 RepID=A0AAU8AT79_9RHOB
MTPTHNVYIAGPDVFFRNASDVMRRKGEMALEHGFLPSTLAEDGDAIGGDTPFAFGLSIGLANERMMDESDFIIANLTPFRGISADVGTAFEVGYMRAQGKPCFAYSNSARDYYTRLTEDFYAGGPFEADGELTRAADGLMIENHGMRDNLMLDTAVDQSGGSFVCGAPQGDDILGDLEAFRAVLIRARAYFDQLG